MSTEIIDFKIPSKLLDLEVWGFEVLSFDPHGTTFIEKDRLLKRSLCLACSASLGLPRWTFGWERLVAGLHKCSQLLSHNTFRGPWEGRKKDPSNNIDIPVLPSIIPHEGIDEKMPVYIDKLIQILFSVV
jgi:hypothetical protein